MKRTALLLAGMAALVLGVRRPAAAQIGFDSSLSDRVRLWNAGYYEFAFRKADGRILSIIDKTTGQEVSPGSVHGPWVMRFADGTWLDGQNFSPSNGSRRFTWAWDAETSILTLTYQANTSYQSRVTLAIQATHGPELLSTLTLLNQSSQAIELISYPVQLSFRRTQINGLYVPYMEGMKLLPSFFNSYEFNSGYPGQLFADFAYTDLSSGRLAVYCNRSLATPLAPSTLMILRDDSYAGGVFKYHHDYDLANGPGQQWTSPLSVISVGASLPSAMAAYWTGNGHDAMPTLADKLGASRLDALAHAVLVKCDLLQGSWTFNSFANYLVNLPAKSLVHLVSFWPRGFDENYPDYLPPNTSLGTQSELQNLVSTARASGHLVMPYTNPTWWDDQSPTWGQLGTSIAAKDRAGSNRYETYGSHGGYVVSPYVAAVITRQNQTRDEFTQTVPCDLLFEDQIGARGPTYDGNSSSPSPMQFNQGLIDVAAASAARLPIMTEGGFDRLAWQETGYCNSHHVGWHWWPPNTFASYPMSPLWAHRNLYFCAHNLAGNTMTNDLPTLTYHISFGYSLSYDRSSGDLVWLKLVDVYQKHMVASLVGVSMDSFELLPAAGNTRTTFGDGTIVTANLAGSSATYGNHVVAANGFLAERNSQVRGGVFTTLYGVPLSGSLPHYLLIESNAYNIAIYQPRGDDGALTVPRPVSWVEDGRIYAWAYATNGAIVSRSVTLSPGVLSVSYAASVNGAATDHFLLSYCNPGDADCDGDVDGTDFSAFSDCLAGPAATPSPTPPFTAQQCLDTFDMDSDFDVDLADFVGFSAAYTGSQ